jgi:hypothetical protein
MPTYDHEHVMTLGEYLSVLDPFLVGVTLLMVVGFFWCMVTVVDLAIKAIMREEP